MCAYAGISGQHIFINIWLFTFMHTLLSLKYYVPDIRSSDNICRIILTSVPYSISYTWYNASEPSCVRLLSGIYISAGIQTTYLTIPKHWAGQNGDQTCASGLYNENGQYNEHIPCGVVCFGFNVDFNNFQSRCLVATGSPMLTCIVLRHWSIMLQTLDMILHLVTLSWHDQS